MAEESGLPVTGVIIPGARRAASLTKNGRIGVIGTRATIGSNAYTRAIHELAPGAEVTSRPCPLFVPLAEEGWVENRIAHLTARHYLQPIIEAGVDTLVLGCTHYPLLKKVIGQEAGDGVTLVDSAESTAAEPGNGGAGRLHTRPPFRGDRHPRTVLRGRLPFPRPHHRPPDPGAGPQSLRTKQ